MCSPKIVTSVEWHPPVERQITEARARIKQVQDKAAKIPPLKDAPKKLAPSGLTPEKDKLVRDMLRGDKGVSYDDVVRQLTPDERLQAAEFFREQAKIAKTPVQKLFNAERANFIERGGPQPPGNLAEFKARHGFEGID